MPGRAAGRSAHGRQRRGMLRDLPEVSELHGVDVERAIRQPLLLREAILQLHCPHCAQRLADEREPERDPAASASMVGTLVPLDLRIEPRWSGQRIRVVKDGGPAVRADEPHPWVHAFLLVRSSSSISTWISSFATFIRLNFCAVLGRGLNNDCRARHRAGYPSRPAFYLRDFAHQSTGAHLLGLRPENLAMARQFAASTSETLQWFSPWSFGFDGSIFKMDYDSATRFVHELPEPFDLVRRIGGVFAWDGGSEWYSDPALAKLYSVVANEFLEMRLNATEPRFEGVAGCTSATCKTNPLDIFTGVATYNEQASHPLQFAADALAAQYAANLALEKLWLAAGNASGAAIVAERAVKLRATFLQHWQAAPGEDPATSSGFVRGFEMNTGNAIAGWPLSSPCSTEIAFQARDGLLQAGSALANQTLDLLARRGAPPPRLDRCELLMTHC